MMKVDAFPLHWPDGYPTSQTNQVSKFDCTLTEAYEGIRYQIRLLVGHSKASTEAIISTNMTLMRDGSIGTGSKMAYPNPGAAVYFDYQGEQKVIACDHWKYVHENLRAIEKTLEAMRGLERWKCTDILSRAMNDMKALPLQAGASAGDAWWVVLGVDKDTWRPGIISAYKWLIKKYHPDNPGEGDREKFDRVQRAYEEAMSQFK